MNLFKTILFIKYKNLTQYLEILLAINSTQLLSVKDLIIDYISNLVYIIITL